MVSFWRRGGELVIDWVGVPCWPLPVGAVDTAGEMDNLSSFRGRSAAAIDRQDVCGGARDAERRKRVATVVGWRGWRLK